MINNLSLEILSPQNVDSAHEFLTRMIGENKGLYYRPKNALALAATKPYRGVMAFIDRQPRGFTALYDTPYSDCVESGSTCVDNRLQGLRLGPLILATALINFYSDPANNSVTIIGDVLQSSTASKRMVDALGFKVIEPPAWYDAEHRGRATAEQISQPYHCVAIDREAASNLAPLYGREPLPKVA